ncbi:hypothetical protein [Pseudalkalibacillus sp. SCS-8]|uniref:hypothetical protein n=1 Tax=Pseudalkalibacillus nanhaiensis TaxID=3115291 RepID=UPI0032DA7246
MVKKMLTVMFMLSLMTVSVATINPPSASAKEYTEAYSGPTKYWRESSYSNYQGEYVYFQEARYDAIYRGYLYFDQEFYGHYRYSGYLYREDQPLPAP